MDSAKKEAYTIEAIHALPEGQRAELVDGKMYMTSAPSANHQRLVSELNYQITDYIKQKDGNCEVFPAPFAVYLNKNNDIYLEPDISVICDKSKVDDEGCKGAPDWIIEIVSPASKRMDYYIKLFKYRSAGVREYWIVDLMEKCITVYDFEHDDGGKYFFYDSVKAGIYEDLEIDFSKLNIQ